MKLIWKDGRFSWPFVAVVAYLATAVFGFDLAWRTTKGPISGLLTTGGIAFVIGAIVLFLAIRFMSRR